MDPSVSSPSSQVRTFPDTDRSRYEIWAGDDLAGYVLYRLMGPRIKFVHTEVEPAFEGRGLGGILARAALDWARSERLEVLPVCPYIAEWIAKHREYEDLVPASRRADYGL
jgi:uncharacterized protein